MKTWKASNWIFELLSFNKFICCFKFSGFETNLFITTKLYRSDNNSARSLTKKTRWTLTFGIPMTVWFFSWRELDFEFMTNMTSEWNCSDEIHNWKVSFLYRINADETFQGRFRRKEVILGIQRHEMKFQLNLRGKHNWVDVFPVEKRTSETFFEMLNNIEKKRTFTSSIWEAFRHSNEMLKRRSERNFLTFNDWRRVT